VTKTADAGEHLERVLQLFWSQGYDNTSIQEVVTLLGLNRFTLYKRLGGKRELLTLTLHRYREVTLASCLAHLSEAHRGIEAIEQYLVGMISLARPPRHSLGCFFVNTAVERASRDPEIERAMQRHFTDVEQGMAAALRGDRLTRDWSDEQVESRCRVLALAAQGLMVQARLGQSHDELRRSVDELLRPEWCRHPLSRWAPSHPPAPKPSRSPPSLPGRDAEPR
jgi:TetR/AcrR family transcriptional repressor of nem operon